jgi:hypothetical protein
MLALADQIEQVISADMDADPFQQTGSSAGEFERVREFLQNRMASIVSQLVDAGQGYPLETTVVGSGTVGRAPDKSTIYDPGEMVELTAIHDAGWEFDHWSGDATGTENPIQVTMNQPMAVVAIFVEDSGAVDDPGGLCLAARPPTIYPNPCGPTTTLSFIVTQSGHVRLAIYDPAGRMVARPFIGRAEAGQHEIPWDGCADNGRPLPPGVYYCRLASAAGSRAGRIVLLE